MTESLGWLVNAIDMPSRIWKAGSIVAWLRCQPYLQMVPIVAFARAREVLQADPELPLVSLEDLYGVKLVIAPVLVHLG